MANPGLLGVIYRLPGLLTMSARLAPKKVVIQQIEPPELETRHHEANAIFEKAAKKHLCTFGGKGMQVLGPPLAERKLELEAAIAEARPKYDELADAVIAAWPEIAEAITAFNVEYAELIKKPRSAALDEPWIRQRFAPRFTWVPVMLSREVEDMLFSPEEQESVRQTIEETMRASYGAKAESLLKEISKSLATAVEAVKSGSPIDRRTLRSVLTKYEDLGHYATGTEQGAKYAGEIEAFGAMLESLKAERDVFDATRRKERTLHGQSGAVGSAASAVDALLDAWGNDELEAAPESAATPRGYALDSLLEAIAC